MKNILIGLMIIGVSCEDTNHNIVHDVSLLSEILLDYPPIKTIHLTPEMCMETECIPWCKFMERKFTHDINDTEQDQHYFKSGIYAYTLCASYLSENMNNISPNTVVVTETIPVGCMIDPCLESCDIPITKQPVYLRNSVHKEIRCVYKINYIMILLIAFTCVIITVIYVGALTNTKPIKIYIKEDESDHYA